MKPSKLSEHLSTLHAEYSNQPLKFFKNVKTKREKRENKRPKSTEYLFKTQSQKLDRGLKASNEIALLIAKKAKPHNIGDELIKPALSVFARCCSRAATLLSKLSH